MKSAASLKSFTAYCEANPDLRFWQALLNWSGYNAIYILMSGQPIDVALSPESAETCDLKDSYNLE